MVSPETGNTRRSHLPLGLPAKAQHHVCTAALRRCFSPPLLHGPRCLHPTPSLPPSRALLLCSRCIHSAHLQACTALAAYTGQPTHRTPVFRCALCCAQGRLVPAVVVLHSLSSQCAHSRPRMPCPAANILLSRVGQMARSASSKWLYLCLSKCVASSAGRPWSCVLLQPLLYDDLMHRGSHAALPTTHPLRLTCLSHQATVCMDVPRVTAATLSHNCLLLLLLYSEVSRESSRSRAQRHASFALDNAMQWIRVSTPD